MALNNLVHLGNPSSPLPALQASTRQCLSAFARVGVSESGLPNAGRFLRPMRSESALTMAETPSTLHSPNSLIDRTYECDIIIRSFYVRAKRAQVIQQIQIGRTERLPPPPRSVF
jgi:hypothetical protein